VGVGGGARATGRGVVGGAEGCVWESGGYVVESAGAVGRVVVEVGGVICVVWSWVRGGLGVGVVCLSSLQKWGSVARDAGGRGGRLVFKRKP